MLGTNVHSVQQYRSQALHDIQKTEVTTSDPHATRKAAIQEMLELINLRTFTSAEFIELINERMELIA